MTEVEKLEEEIAFWMGDDDDLQSMYARLENLRVAYGVSR